METRIKFKILVDKHHRYVFAICLRILVNRSEAEDVVQEVYERAWKHIDQIAEPETKPWLAKVARNLCIDRLRARKPNTSIEHDSEEFSCEQHSQSETIEQQQVSEWLMSAITRLHEPYKSIILMAEIQQKSNKEVSQSVGLNENQVKVYAYRARQKLKSLLQATRHLHEVGK